MKQQRTHHIYFTPLDSFEMKTMMKTSNNLRLGDVVQLLHDGDEFRAAFSRVEGDMFNGWTPEKHSLRGKKGTVAEIYENSAISITFSDGKQFDFPLEAAGISSSGDGNTSNITLDDLQTWVGPLEVTVHDHPLHLIHAPYGEGNGFGCSGKYLPAGCQKGVPCDFNIFDPFRCAQCDFDLCDKCTILYIGKKGTNSIACRLLPGYRMTVVSHYHITETYNRDPWVCAGVSLKGGCKSGYTSTPIQSNTTRFRSNFSNYDLCKSCFDAYEIPGEVRFDQDTRGSYFKPEKVLINEDGVQCNYSYDDRHELEARIYCKRNVGMDGYHRRGNDDCTECDGVCGPRGCQCKACYRLNARPKISSHQITLALKKGHKEWRRSKIMIVGEGRAGKSALANSIIGKEFQNTESTMGINQLTCNVNYATLGEGLWNECKKPDREFEAAIAQNVLAIKKKEQERRKHTDVTVSSLSQIDDASKRKNHSKSNNHSNQSSHANNKEAITDLELERAEQVGEPEEVDRDLIVSCLADNVEFGSNLVISVNDCGGQSVFNVIHHFFLTRYGVYALVFNMEWLLDDATEEVHNRCWSYLKFWMNSITVHTWNVEEHSMAPVVLVGTRKDKVSSAADHEKIHTKLYNMFSRSIAWPFVIENDNAIGVNGRLKSCFFAVDNTKSRHDPTMCDLMSSIEKSMNDSAYTHMQVPLSWMRALDKVSALNKAYIPLDEFSLLTDSCSVDRDDVVPFLHFMNETSNLMWHNEPGLREMVILNPIEFFVKPATIIICKHSPDENDPTHHVSDLHKKASKKFMKKWIQLTEHGVLHRDILSILWEEYDPSIRTLVNLMVKFGLLVPLRDNVSNNGKGDGKIIESAIECERYLVPCLLLPSKVDDHLWFEDTPFSSCFFVFTATDDFMENVTINNSDLLDTGFLPNGLFERIIGKSVDWCMRTSPTGKINLDCVYKDVVILRFGNQLFRLVLLAQYNCIRLDVAGKNPLIVFNRISDQIVDSIAECMGALCVFPCVPYTPDGSQPTLDVASDSCILIPLARVQDAVQNFSVLSRPGGRALLDSNTAKKLYAPWLHIYELLERYDMFLSYRWGPFDKFLVHAVFDMMMNFNVGTNHRAVEVFLDDVRLKNGRRFQDDFIKSLKSSLIFVPVVSFDSLQKMLTHDVDSVDNVLLEWIFAIECLKSDYSRVKNILPLMVGERDKLTGHTSRLPGSAIINKLPNVSPSATINAVQKALSQNNMTPSCNLEVEYTIKKVVVHLLGFIGVTITDDKDSNTIEQVSNTVVQTLKYIVDNDDLTDVVVPTNTTRAAVAVDHGELSAKGRDVASSAALQSQSPAVPSSGLLLSSPLLDGPTSGTPTSRPLPEMITALRVNMCLSDDLKMMEVLKHTMQELDLEEECSKRNTVAEKAKFLVTFLGV